MTIHEKYNKGKRTTILVSVETSKILNDLKYDLRVKSIDDVINYLILKNNI